LTHKTNIFMYQSRKVSGHIKMRVLSIKFDFVSMCIRLDLGLVPTVWYFLIFHLIAHFVFLFYFQIVSIIHLDITPTNRDMNWAWNKRMYTRGATRLTINSCSGKLVLL
jgi:hypothetical protein